MITAKGCGQRLKIQMEMDESGVPQWSILRAVLFSAFISNVDSEIEAPSVSVQVTAS